MNGLMKGNGWTAAVVAALGVMAAGSAAAQSFDFETPNQYQGNFRQLFGATNLGQPASAAQTANDAANDYVSIAANVAVTTVYDSTPTTATTRSSYAVSKTAPLTVSTDVRLGGNNSSFGVYIVDAADETKGYLALLNVNNTGTQDLFRFASNAQPTTGGAGTLTGSTFAEALDTGAFGNLSVTYSINDANNPVLSLTVGSVSQSYTITGITTPLTNVEIGFRDSAQAGGPNDFDNVVITGTPVPEPASLALLGLGGLPLFRRGRRRNA